MLSNRVYTAISFVAVQVTATELEADEVWLDSMQIPMFAHLCKLKTLVTSK